MEFQLVIQVEAGSGGLDLGKLVELENAVSEALEDSADVDGHDIGSGEANIFVNTRDPVVTVTRLIPLLRGPLAHARVAFRPSDGSTYTVLWPLGSNEPFQVR